MTIIQLEGAGDTYIQVPKRQVENLLAFLDETYPVNGFPINLAIGSQSKPGLEPERVEFCSKSAGRMRIANQNRHRKPRLNAWSPSNGFPTLQPSDTTSDAKKLLTDLGGLHIYIARSVNGSVWAGYTIGLSSAKDARQPFANILWGLNNPGGYWAYEEGN